MMKKILTVFILACLSCVVYAQDNVIDEIVWVVGDDAILRSDIESQRLYLQNEGQRFDGDPYCVLPEQMAIQKLFLNQAKIDSVEVSENQVIQETDRWINFAINQMGSKEKLEEYAEFFEMRHCRGDENLAKEYGQVYERVEELLLRLEGLLGEEKADRKNYIQILEAGFEEIRVGVIPATADQVMIGDLTRSRLESVKVLFFAGLNEGLVPQRKSGGSLLTDTDREIFRSFDMELAPTAREDSCIQKFYLYMNLTKPEEFLHISYSKVSSDGKTLRPAYLVWDLKKLFPKLVVTEEEALLMTQRELTPGEGLEFVIRGVRDRYLGVDESWKELYTWYRQNEGQKVDRILDAGFFKKKPDALTGEEAAELYGEKKQFSVTRMERFSACAYAHFLTYGLHLSDRERYEFEAMDLGNIAHQSMERFARKAQEKRMPWPKLEEVQRDAMIEESVEESIKDYGNTVLYSTARNEYMIVRIKQLIRRSVWALTRQMEKGDFEPSGYEMNFGSGKIDRVDTCEDEDVVYVKVTDYKTGMKSFDIVALYHGLQMQLPVYLNAALELEERRASGKTVEPAGIFYYRIKDPIVDREKDDHALEEKILKELRLDGMINAKEEVIEHLEHQLSGTSVLNPIGKNKDGSLNRYSKVLPPEAFAAMLSYTKKKEARVKRQIYAGEVQANPYELNGSTGCDYCAYRDICGFDPRLDGYAYRSLEKYSKEEVIRRMEEEIENREEPS